MNNSTVPFLALAVILAIPQHAAAASDKTDITSCSAAQCQADLNQLQVALGASFNKAEIDGSSAVSKSQSAKRYAISRDTKEISRWAAEAKATRVAIFSVRDAQGSLKIQSIALLASGPVESPASSRQPTASLALVGEPGAAEANLWDGVRNVQLSTLKPKVLSYDQMLKRIHDFKGVVALASVASGGRAATLAFIPDFVNINMNGIAGASTAGSYIRPTEPDATAGGTEAAEGEIISSKPGETVRLIRDKNGAPAELQFDVDPAQFAPGSSHDGPT